MENNELIVQTIPLDHSLPCCGFLFKEKIKPRRMRKKKFKNLTFLPNLFLPLKQVEIIF